MYFVNDDDQHYLQVGLDQFHQSQMNFDDHAGKVHLVLS